MLARRCPHVVVCLPPGRKVVYAQDLVGTTVRFRCLMRLAVVLERQDFCNLREEVLGASWSSDKLVLHPSLTRLGWSALPGSWSAGNRLAIGPTVCLCLAPGTRVVVVAVEAVLEIPR